MTSAGGPQKAGKSNRGCVKTIAHISYKRGQKGEGSKIKKWRTSHVYVPIRNRNITFQNWQETLVQSLFRHALTQCYLMPLKRTKMRKSI